MARFRPEVVERPTSLDEALELLKKWGSAARVVAGNTTLHQLAASGALEGVRCLIDISGLDLEYIVEDKGGLIRLGAMATFSTIASSEAVAHASCRALRDACRKITPIQVRNMGTVGGALASGLPFYDLPVALLALDARILIRSSESTRTIAIDDLFVAPFVSALAPEELIVEAQITKREMCGSSFVKIGRTSVDFAVVNAAVMIALDGASRKISEARIALGGVSGTPVRHREAEKLLIGERPDEEVVREASLAPVGFEPLPSIHASSEYKRVLITVVTRNAVMAAVANATHGGVVA